MRVKNRKAKKAHWLDHAEDEFDVKLIGEIKLVLNIFTMFVTVPIFWALYDQKVSVSNSDCSYCCWFYGERASHFW